MSGPMKRAITDVKGSRKHRKKTVNQGQGENYEGVVGLIQQVGKPMEVPPRGGQVGLPRSLPVATAQDRSQGIKFLPSVVCIANEFLLGPKLSGSPVECIQHYLGRRVDGDDFYVMKVLTLKGSTKEELKDELCGQTTILTENSLLSLLAQEPGIFHGAGLIKEIVKERIVSSKDEVTWKDVRRFCLAVECYVYHDFSPKYRNLVTLQIYVINEKRLVEGVALHLFYKMLEIVERIHKHNIVHRDLKLGNFILNMDTKEVTLANFVLGQHLGSELQMLCDQRGSPAYVSPEVVSGKPYFGKPTDMWSLGVVLFTMLFGAFPFYDQDPKELFRKIKTGWFDFPTTENLDTRTLQLIKSLLHLDWQKRPTASQALKDVLDIISEQNVFMKDSVEQIVPESDPGGYKGKVRRMRTYLNRYARIVENENRMRELLDEAEREAEIGNHVGGIMERTSFVGLDELV